MRKHHCRFAALILCMAMLLAALCAGGACEETFDTSFLGKPFPDFTVTDTDGNTFTLSEALKDHEAVLINFWATWCGPCKHEFPYLNEAYEKYRDRVAFIALSKENKDTTEKIAAFKKENGLSLPMGRNEDGKASQTVDLSGIPVTVVVDRFGNAVFAQRGGFINADEVGRVLDAFLGDSYTETTVLEKIPVDTTTRSFPVGAARAIYPDSGNYKKVLLHVTSHEKPFTGFIVPDDSVRLRIEITAEDNAVNMVYTDLYEYKLISVLKLMDPERGVFVYDQKMYNAEDEDQFLKAGLGDYTKDPDEKTISVLLFRNEEDIDKFAERYKAEGLGEITWEYADEAASAKNSAQAYIIHVVDQNNNPVEEVTVNFCTDTACTPQETDETGTITYEAAPYKYHVQIIDAPEGYSWDEGFDMYTPAEYGEWVLRVRKD